MFDLDFKKIKTQQLTFSPLKIIPRNLMWNNTIFSQKKVFFSPLPKITIHDEMNVFEQVRPSETDHSDILCELLNPQGKHATNTLFLSLFFEHVIKDVSFNPKYKWYVTAEKGRFDIRIRNNNNSCIIIIENKSNWAGDQPNQLYRYWYHGIFLPQYSLQQHGQKTEQYIFYLSPNDYKQPTKQTFKRPDRYDVNLPPEIPNTIEIKKIFFNKEIVEWLDKCLDSIDDNTSNVYFYIKQYLSFWRNR